MNPYYYQTVFTLSDEDRQSLPGRFAVITAYNPRGLHAPESRNRHQDQALRAVLEARGIQPQRVIGSHPTKAHQEPGWGAALTLRDALQIGRTFKQLAIYYVEDDLLKLCSCVGDEVVELGSFRERIQP